MFLSYMQSNNTNNTVKVTKQYNSLQKKADLDRNVLNKRTPIPLPDSLWMCVTAQLLQAGRWVLDKRLAIHKDAKLQDAKWCCHLERSCRNRCERGLANDLWVGTIFWETFEGHGLPSKSSQLLTFYISQEQHWTVFVALETSPIGAH